MSLQTCPKCRALLPPGTKKCPYCQTDQGGVLVKSPQADAQQTVNLALGTIGACVFLYFAMVALEPEPTQGRGIQGPSSIALRIFGLYDTSLAHGCGQWWRMVTAMFVHLDLMHLVFNMVAIYILAPLAAQTFGTARTVVVYLGAGLGAAFVNHYVGGNWGGASGGIAGLIGACAVYGHRRGLHELRQRMLFWIVIIFAFGMFFKNVDHFGHFIGIVTGASIGWFASGVRAPGSRADRFWQNGALALGSGVLAIGVLFLVPSIVRSFSYSSVGRYHDEATSVISVAKQKMAGVRDAGKFDLESVNDAPSGADDLKRALVQLIERVQRGGGAANANAAPDVDARAALAVANQKFLRWRDSLWCRYAYLKTR